MGLSDSRIHFKKFLTSKNKLSIILPAKMGLFGNNNYNSRHARYDKTIGKPEEEQRREIFFYRGKGGGFYKHSPLEKRGAPSVVLSISRVRKRADLLPGKEKSLPSSCWGSKVETYSCWRLELRVSFFPFGVIDGEVVSHKSSPYRPSWLHCTWGFYFRKTHLPIRMNYIFQDQRYYS